MFCKYLNHISVSTSRSAFSFFSKITVLPALFLLVLLVHAPYATAQATCPNSSLQPSAAISLLKSHGDADCTGGVTLVDFSIWLAEYKGDLGTDRDGDGNMMDADFDGSGTVTLKDYQIWKTEITHVNETSYDLDQSSYGANEQVVFDETTMMDASTLGVVPDLGDVTGVLNSALETAKQNNKTVFLPQGTYNHGGIILMNGSRLVGQNAQTILRATDGQHGSNASLGDHVVEGTSSRAILITGSGSQLKNVVLDAATTVPRYGGPDSDGIHCKCSNATIEHVTVNGGTGAESYFGAGIHVDSWDNPIQDVTINRNLVINTNADRIRIAGWNDNVVRGIIETNNMVISLVAGAPGDDDYSYIGNNNTTIEDVSATQNISLGPKRWGAGADFQGVRGGIFANNYIAFEKSGHGPGIIVQVPTTYPGPGTIGLVIKQNTLIGTGRNDDRGPLGAIAIDEGPVSDLQILNNTISQSVAADISANGGGVKNNIIITGNHNPDGPLDLQNSLATGIVTWDGPNPTTIPSN